MFLLLTFFFVFATAKVYDRCELARELKYTHKAPDHQLATWVCIAEHESQYNTSIVGHLSGDGSGDHGIFQISDKFWCSPPGKGHACGLTCAMLEDDDISDDFVCAQRIYKEHKALSGDGFNAWAVYKPHCKDWKSNRYIKDCFKGDVSETPRESDLTSQFSDFAHGFFGTVAGKSHFSPSTESPTNDDLLTATSTSYNDFPVENTAVFAQKSIYNYISTLINNPPASSSASIVPATNTLSERGFFFNPTTTTTTKTSFVPYSEPLDKTSSSLYTSASGTFSSPTTLKPLHQSTVSSIKPIFIINGVKWI